MRRTLAMLTGTTLLLPATALAAPAGAATAAAPAVSAPAVSAPAASAVAAAATATRKKTCATKRHNVRVRIRFSDNGRFTRVRVSHPRGTGKFRESRVRYVRGTTGGYSSPPPDENGQQISGAWRDRDHRLKRTFRTQSVADGYSGIHVHAKFRLRNGKTVSLRCSMS